MYHGRHRREVSAPWHSVCRDRERQRYREGL